MAEQEPGPGRDLLQAVDQVASLLRDRLVSWGVINPQPGDVVVLEGNFTDYNVQEMQQMIFPHHHVLVLLPGNRVRLLHRETNVVHGAFPPADTPEDSGE